MTKNLVLGVALFTLTLAAAVFGQTRDTRSPVANRYVISAKAGAVNYVEGDVTFVTASGRGGLLIKGDSLEIGDKASTGVDSKAEILLNPGSYLRLGANTQFEFVTTSLDDLQLKVDSGSAILEVFAADDFRVNVIVPNGEFDLVRTGVYRVDVVDGKGTISVWKGMALVTDSDSGDTIIKSGREASVEGDDVTVEKFDRGEKDALDVWSKNRAKELAKITSSLERRQIQTSLVNSFNGGGWNVYDSFGLWVYDARRGYSGFLPFGFDWVSGYGHWFRNSIGWYNLPRYVYYPPTVTTFTGTASGTTAGSGSAGIPRTTGTTTTRTGTTTTNSPRTRSTGGRVTPGPVRAAPPFARMPSGGSSPFGSSGGSGFPSGGRSFPSGGSPGGAPSSPSRSSSPISAPVNSAPVSAGALRMGTKNDN